MHKKRIIMKLEIILTTRKVSSPAGTTTLINIHVSTTDSVPPQWHGNPPEPNDSIANNELRTYWGITGYVTRFM